MLMTTIKAKLLKQLASTKLAFSRPTISCATTYNLRFRCISPVSRVEFLNRDFSMHYHCHWSGPVPPPCITIWEHIREGHSRYAQRMTWDLIFLPLNLAANFFTSSMLNYEVAKQEYEIFNLLI
jgi:hypothetical protein